jgi:phosphohistidine phosphatase
MKRLVLMRHAKSAWDDPILSDKERPLNERGRESASALGEWLRDKGYLPDIALVSSSERTRETFGLLDLDREAEFLDALYLASPMGMMQVLEENGGDAETVLMIAHNPGIGALAAELAGAAADADLSRYPTGATAVFSAESAGWSGVGPGDLKLVDFVVPKSLL